ncbi:hypothetical protein Sdia_33090 [Streptomyces diastaticus subsp. diastaticus]|uniref:Uncharacterized protein n=1 Tax=Streptomyces diastaticus subsp. diastaticus TaxID=68040 RepID=A0ABQ1CQA2_STRDI|nr:hypothetical protein Sdia_33090 [Streptomyces diastaticus subsp. diastaticus]
MAAHSRVNGTGAPAAVAELRDGAWGADQLDAGHGHRAVRAMAAARAGSRAALSAARGRGVRPWHPAPRAS